MTNRSLRLHSAIIVLVFGFGSANGADVGDRIIPMHKSAAEVINLVPIEMSPAELAAIDTPQYASFRNQCRLPGTLSFVFEFSMLGKLQHRRTLFLDVVPAAAKAEDGGGEPTHTKDVKLDPAIPMRPNVAVGESFTVQWTIQGVDFPGEWKLRKIKFQPAKGTAEELPVSSVEQAVAKIRVFERKLYRQTYGKAAESLPPLASAGKPHSVDESDESFRIEYRMPFLERGGGYIKTFSVSKNTGEVSRLLWQLGR